MLDFGFIVIHFFGYNSDHFDLKFLSELAIEAFHNLFDDFRSLTVLLEHD